jgi:AcrR family transcriptional regulator
VSSEPSTRRRILDAARRSLEAHAWAGLRLEDVARAAGVSRQSIYLHFGSRPALLLALVEHVDEVEGLAALVAHVRAAADGIEALDRLVALNARYEPRIRAVVVAHDAARHQDADLEAAWQDRMRRRRALCRYVVQRLEADGALAPGLPADEATDVLWALLSSRVHEDLVHARRWSRRRYEARMRAVLRSTVVGS